jgi:VanZ family protein
VIKTDSKETGHIFIVIVILIGMLYGLSDEFHQSFVPGRACTFTDLMTDTAGVLTAAFIYILTYSKRIVQYRKHW